MILYRCFAWNDTARPRDSDGALWVPRIYQGDGRHDNPDLYGCLYLAQHPISCIVEQLARFRGQSFSPRMLVRRGLPLALAALQLDEAAELLDLDDPAVLRRLRLRPSLVATRQRDVTRPGARSLFERHPAAVGLRWWSTFEALWSNVTLFDRAGPHLRLQSVRTLDASDPALEEATRFLGL